MSSAVAQSAVSALRISAGDDVAVALRDLGAGEALRVGVGDAAPAVPPGARAVQTAAMTRPDATFMGYRRGDGRVGTRNEIWVLCSVGCVANTARRIAEKGAARHAGRVDGIHAYTHVFGCSQLGDDLANT